MRRKPGTLFCLSLGCAKNRVDSERIVGLMAEAGFEPVDRAEGARTCIVNTCGFLESAVRENIDAILDLIGLKERGRISRLGVVGCLVNRYGAELPANLPEVDFWAGCEDYGAILSAVGGTGQAPEYPKRRPLPGDAGHTRYLKLSEGCDNRCSYCAIPGIRGTLRSVSLGLLVSEALGLVEEGAREICLVGQDLTAYGRDRGVGGGLVELLDALESSLPKDVWLRLLYLHPDGVDRALLERVACGVQTLPYLDIPIQHASPRILFAMNRRTVGDALRGIFETARRIRPDFALRTTCMVGFPGEKRRDFDLLLRFLADVRFDRLGAFLYSPEEGTAAASLPGQVSNRTKRARLERLVSLQETISLERQGAFVGEELDVVIDTVGDGLVEGRSFREAPEVDGVIEIRGARASLAPGDLIRVVVREAFEHDMVAEEVRAKR